MKGVALTTMLLLMSWHISKAQWELGTEATYNLPLGNLKSAYGPGAGVLFSALKGHKYKKKRFVIGVSLGYTRFHPRQAVLYYSLDSTTLDGEVRYLAYETGRITLTLRRDFILTQHAELFLGMDIGYQYVYYEYNNVKTMYQMEESIFETKFGMIPKAGLSYMLSKRLGINLSVKYDIMIGETNKTGFPYNPDASNFTTCLEFGTGVFFRFVD